MDREEIQRRDFPVGRRGYDPASVDEHLRRVADDFDAHLRQPAAGLSAGASEQVRVILEAAERSAAELRSKAGEEASDHVARVQAAAAGMLGRLDDLDRELGGLLDALRAAGERLNSGLAKLREDVRDGAEPPLEPPAIADDAGARLIALNMALSGVTRSETARYLAEHFGLTDTQALLDDVYARAQR